MRTPILGHVSKSVPAPFPNARGRSAWGRVCGVAVCMFRHSVRRFDLIGRWTLTATAGTRLPLPSVLPLSPVLSRSHSRYLNTTQTYTPLPARAQYRNSVVATCVLHAFISIFHSDFSSDFRTDTDIQGRLQNFLLPT